jgi:hypothetical protein
VNAAQATGRRDRAREIRERLTDAKALCAALGCKIAPRSSAPQATILCPSHGERTPSCSVRIGNDGTLAVKCHACGWTADALGLIKAVEGISDFADILTRGAELANAPGLAVPVVSNHQRERTQEGISDETYHSVWTFALDALSPMREVAPHVADTLTVDAFSPKRKRSGCAGYRVTGVSSPHR